MVITVSLLCGFTHSPANHLANQRCYAWRTERERERHRADGLNELKAHRWAAAAAGEGGN